MDPALAACLVSVVLAFISYFVISALKSNRGKKVGQVDRKTDEKTDVTIGL